MRSEERRTEITRAAIKCFAAAGYHAAQISDIIDEAGIARGTFYLYFKSKHDIFKLILDDLTAHIRAQIKDIALDSVESPALQMRKNIERLIDTLFTSPELAKIIFNEAVGLDREIDDHLKDFYKHLIGIISSSIRRGMKEGLVRNVDPDTVSCIALGGIRELVVQDLIFKNTSLNRDTIIDTLINVIFFGLAGQKMA